MENLNRIISKNCNREESRGEVQDSSRKEFLNQISHMSISNLQSSINNLKATETQGNLKQELENQKAQNDKL